MKIIREVDEKEKLIRIRVKDDNENLIWNTLAFAFLFCAWILLYIFGYGVGWLFALFGLGCLAKTV